MALSLSLFFISIGIFRQAMDPYFLVCVGFNYFSYSIRVHLFLVVSLRFPFEGSSECFFCFLFGLCFSCMNFLRYAFFFSFIALYIFLYVLLYVFLFLCIEYKGGRKGEMNYSHPSAQRTQVPRQQDTVDNPVAVASLVSLCRKSD